MEIIIVNDGSVDGSKEIIERMQREDERIKLVNKNNGGASAARNEGIECCKGDYIYFVDSDDYVDEKIIEKYLSTIQGHDMVIGRIFDVYDDKMIDRYHIESNITFMDDKMYMQRMARGFNTTYFGGLVNKLYNAKIIKENGLKLFTDVTYREDEMFNICYLYHVKSVGVVSEPMYYYQRDIGVSLSDNKRVQYKWDMFNKAINAFVELCKGKQIYDECRQDINKAIAEQIIWPTQEIIMQNKRKVAVKKLKKLYTKEHIKAITQVNNTSFTIKIVKISLKLHSYTLAYLLINLLKNRESRRTRNISSITVM